MNTMKDYLEELKQNMELTPDQINSMDPQEEYLKDGDIYCKNCNTPRTCDGITKKVRCRCKCELEKIEERREIERRAERLRHLEKLKVDSLLGERYKGVTFENTDVTDAEFRAVFDRFRRYCDVSNKVLQEGVGIYLYGKKGTGKTHLTACAANELMSRYYSVLYTNFAEISKTIRQTYNDRQSSEADFMKKLAEIDFLFIDDFGTELVTRGGEDLWLQEKIFEVVNKRYNSKKPIIFTSNYSLAEILKERGLADKTVDRINEMCETMKLDGKSYRLKAKNQREQLF